MSSKNPLAPTDPEVVARRKALASSLHDNPTWHEALDAMKQHYTEQWERSSAVASLERDNAYYMVRAVEGLRSQIQSFAQAGKLSKDVSQNNVKRS